MKIDFGKILTRSWAIIWKQKILPSSAYLERHPNRLHKNSMGVFIHAAYCASRKHPDRFAG